MITGVEIDEEALEGILTQVALGLQVIDEDLEEAGTMVLARILRRTRRGLDVNGVPFAPYAESTRRQRKKRRRRSSKVRLQDTGKMLAAATSRVSGSEAVLHFSSATEGRKARWHNEGTRHLPERRWFEASDDDLDRAAKLIARRIAKRVSK